MLINYVKFRRGTQQDFAVLKQKGTVEQDTLYFIYSESGETVDLYLGTKLISSGENDLGNISSNALNALADVSINEPQLGDILIYDTYLSKWKNKSIEQVLEDYDPKLTSVVVLNNNNNDSHENLINQAMVSLTPVTGDFIIIKDQKDDNVFNHTTYLYSGQEWIKISSTTNFENFIINSNQFGVDDKGNLILKDSDKAAAGDILSVGENGQLEWTAPKDTYTKNEIDSKLAAAGSLTRIILKDKAEIESYYNSEDYDKYIFMIEKSDKDDENYYEEYIIVLDSQSQKVIEQIGSWNVDLSDYYRKDEDIPVEAIKNIGVENLSETLLNSIITTEKINSNQFEMKNGVLNLKDVLSPTNYVTVEKFNKAVGNLDDLLENQVSLYENIADLNNRLTWQDIENI